MFSIISFLDMKKLKAEWKVQAVLEPALVDLELTTATIAQIREKKVISDVIKQLADRFPLPKEYLFLKRIKCREDCILVIVCIGDSEAKDLEDIQGLMPNSIRKAEIPSKQPRTRCQFEKSKQFWPCHFHEDKRLEAVLAKTLPEVWGDEAFDTHCANMQRLLGSSRPAALAWDPKGRRQVAFAYDTQDEHNVLRHAAMNLIDCVAHAQGGGAWTLADFEEDTNEKSYLLTDYDVYLSHEPCIMCSMALVHSRVSRVFFSQINSISGGLCSLCRLQTVSSLNHSFEVYHMEVCS